ncbi:mucin-16-like [Nycticebus coucang]|uniref:mucin-16-like n=1 Tax=Nycticebus coucang TaxID=9470 RepID=UPI00234D68B7|nr:mucin-16-like [Nycticebus coucang]
MSPVTSTFPESSSSQETTSVTATSRVLPQVPTADTTHISGTDAAASGTRPSSGPGKAKESHGITPVITTELLASPATSPSAQVTITTHTGTPSSKSPGSLTEEPSSALSWQGPQSTRSQGFPRSEGTTPVSTGLQEDSRTTHPPVVETSSVSSLLSSPASASPSPVPSTFPDRAPSSAPPVTSLPTSGLAITLQTLVMSHTAETSSTLNISGSTYYTQATPEAPARTRAGPPSAHTEVTHIRSPSSGHGSPSSGPGDWDTSGVTSPVATISTREDSTPSTAVGQASGTGHVPMEPRSPLTSTQKETSSSQDALSAAPQTSTVHSAGTIQATAEVPTPAVISSTTISDSDQQRSTASPHIRTPMTTQSLTTPLTMASVQGTAMTPVGVSMSTSQEVLDSDTRTKSPLGGTPLTRSQRFPHSHTSTLVSWAPDTTSRTRPGPVAESSPAPTLQPSVARTSPFPVASTLGDSTPSSPPPVTSLLTSALLPTLDSLSTSPPRRTTACPNFSSSSHELLAMDSSTASTEAVIHSTRTVATHTGTSSAAHASHTPFPTGSETSKAKSPMVITSPREDSTSSISPTHIFQATQIQTQPTSHLTSAFQESSSSQETARVTAISSVLSQVPTAATTHISRTDTASLGTRPTSGPGKSTESPGVTPGTTAELLASPATSPSAQVTITTHIGPPRSASLGNLTGEPSSTPSSQAPQSTRSQGFPCSEGTTPGSTGPQEDSRTTHPPMGETSSASSLPSSPASASPSPVPSTFPDRAPSSAPPMTSLPTSGLTTTIEILGTSHTPGASSTLNFSVSTHNMQATPEAPAHTRAGPPSGHVTVTHVKTPSSGHGSLSSAPGDREISSITSPVAADSTREDSIPSTAAGQTSGTGHVPTEPTSLLASAQRESTYSQDTLSTTPQTSPVHSAGTTRATSEVPELGINSSAMTSDTDQERSTALPGIRTPMTTQPLTTPVMTASVQEPAATPMGAPGSTSQEALASDTVTTSSQGRTLLTRSQPLPHSPTSTLVSWAQGTASWTTPGPVAETDPAPPLRPSAAGTSPSPMASTLGISIPTLPPLVTSLLTSASPPTLGILGTSPPHGTSAHPNFSSSSRELLATDSSTARSEAVSPSTPTVATHKGTTSAGHASHSPFTVGLETSKATSPKVITFTGEDSTPSTSPAHISQVTKLHTQPMWPLTSAFQENSSSQETTSVTATSNVLSQVPTAATTHISGTDAASSGTRPTSDPGKSTESPGITPGITTKLLTSSAVSALAQVTIKNHTGPPGSASHSSLTGEPSSTPSWQRPQSTGSQGVPSSEGTTPGNTGPQEDSQTTYPPVMETRSASSLLSSPAITSSSPVLSTLPDSAPSSAPPVTSLPTSGLATTLQMLGVSHTPGASSHPSSSSSTHDAWATPEAPALIRAGPPSAHTAVTHARTLSSGHGSSFSGPGDQETSRVTSPVAAREDSTPSTVSGQTSGNGHVSTKLSSPLASIQTETSSSQDALSAAQQTSKVHSTGMVGATAEAPAPPAAISSATTMPGQERATVLPRVGTPMTTQPLTTPVMTASAQATTATPMGAPGSMSQVALASDAATTSPRGGRPLTGSQRFPQLPTSTLVSWALETASWTGPSPGTETSPALTLRPLAAGTSPFPVASTLGERIYTSPPPVTSLLTSASLPTLDNLGTSPPRGTSASPNFSISSRELPAMVGIMAHTEAVSPSTCTVATHTGTASPGDTSHTPSPARSETSKAISLKVITSPREDSMLSMSPAHISQATQIHTWPTSSLTSTFQESSYSQETASVTAKSSVVSQVPTAVTTHISGTDAASSVTRPTSRPGKSTESPGVTPGTIAELLTYSATSVSAQVITTHTGPPTSASLGSLTREPSSATSCQGPQSKRSQGFPRSEGTTPGSTGPQEGSQTTHLPVEETSSVSFLLSSPVISSPSPVSSTFPDRASSSAPPMTSLPTSGLATTLHMLGASHKPGASSPLHFSGSWHDTQATPEVSAHTRVGPPSVHTTVTHCRIPSSERGSPSSGPGDWEIFGVTSPLVAISTREDSTPYTVSGQTSGTGHVSTKLSSPLASIWTETSSSQDALSAAQQTSTVHSAGTAWATTKASAPSAAISSATTTPGQERATVSPRVGTPTTTQPLTALVMTASAQATTATPMGAPRSILQGALASDTATTSPRGGRHLTGSQQFPHSLTSTVVSWGLETASWSRPGVGVETSTARTLQPPAARTSPSPVAFTLGESIPTSLPPVTSLLTSASLPTLDSLGTSPPRGTSARPNFSSSSRELPAMVGIKASTEAVSPSTHTVTTHTGTASAGSTSLSPFPAGSETSKAKSPIVIASTGEDSTPSTSPAHISQATQIHTQPTSSLTSAFREIRYSQETTSVKATSSVLSQVPTIATTHISGTDAASLGTRPTSGLGKSTDSLGVTPGITTELLTSSAASAEVTITTHTGPPWSVSRGSLPGETSSTPSWQGSQSTKSQGFPQSEGTTPGNTGRQEDSQTTHPPMEETSSVSSLLSSPAIASPSPVSSTFPDRAPSSGPPVTSLPTLVRDTTLHTLAVSHTPGASSSPSFSGSTHNMRTTTEALARTRSGPPSAHAAVTQVRTPSSGHGSQYSGPGNQETSSVTSPLAAISIREDSTSSTAAGQTSGTGHVPTEPCSLLASAQRETSSSQDALSSVPQTTTVHSAGTMQATTEVPVPAAISSASTSDSDQERSTALPRMRIPMTSQPLTAPLMTASAKGTTTTPTGAPGSTSQGALASDTPTTSPRGGTPLTGSQPLPYSLTSTLVSWAPETASWTEPGPVTEINPALTLRPSAVASTMGDSIPTSTPPVTSLITSTSLPTLENLGSSPCCGTSAHLNFSSSSGELLATDSITAFLEAVSPSTRTVATHMETASAGHTSHSPFPVGSEKSKATSLKVITSTREDSTPSTSPAHIYQATKLHTQPTSPLTSAFREIRYSQETALVTATSSVLSQVPTVATTHISGTDAASSGTRPTLGPEKSTESPGITPGTTAKLLTSPAASPSAQVTITNHIHPPGSALLGCPPREPSSAPSWQRPQSTSSQGFPQSEGTTPGSTGLQGGSQTTHSPVGETRSAFSLLSSPAIASPSPVSSTFPDRALSSAPPVISLPTSGLATTLPMLGASHTPRASSHPSFSSSTHDMQATPKAPASTGAGPPSAHAVVTHIRTPSSGCGSPSSGPGDRDTSGVTSPMAAISTREDFTPSTAAGQISGIGYVPTEPRSPLGSAQKETSSSQDTLSGTPQTSTVLSAGSARATTEISVPAAISSATMSNSGQQRSTASFRVLTPMTTQPLTAPLMKASIQGTTATPTGAPGSTSQEVLDSDTRTKSPCRGTSLTGSQRFPHSPTSTLVSWTPDTASWTRPGPVAGTSPAPTLRPSAAGTSPSPMASTLGDRTPTSPLPMTSLLTSALLPTLDSLGSSPPHRTTARPNFSSSSRELLATDSSMASMEAVSHSTHTVATHKETSSVAHATHSPFPMGSETSKATSVLVITSTGEDSMPSTFPTHISQATQIQTQPISPLTSTFQESSSSQETAWVTATSSVLSHVPTAATTHISRTDTASSGTRLTSGLGKSTESPSVTPGTIAELLASPATSPSAQVTIKTHTGFPESASLCSLTGEPSSTPSWQGPQSTKSQGFPQSEGTTPGSTEPQEDSQTTHPPMGETSSVSFLLSSPAITSPPPVPSTFPERAPSAAPPKTSLPTSGLATTFHMLGASHTPGASSPPSFTSSMHDTQAIPEAPARTGAGPPSAHTTVTHVRTPSLGRGSPSSGPGDQETFMVTSPVAAISTREDLGTIPTSGLGTDGHIEHITKIPSEAAHRGTLGPVKGPLASTSPASTRGGTERAETTATALKTITAATLTARVYTSTSRTLTFLKTSVQTSTTSTAGMTTTTPGVSPDVSEMTTSLATRLETETGTGIPRITPTVFNREPETTVPLVPNSGAETSPTVQIASSGELNTTVSWISQPIETTSIISKATLNVSYSESYTTPSTTTSPDAEVSTAVPTPAASRDVPDTVTSMTTSPVAETSMVTPTDSPDEPETTASEVTHPSSQTSYSILTLTVSPSVPGSVTSLDTSSGAETSPGVQTLTVSPSKPAAIPPLVPFTLNFTITNLQYQEDMQRPGSQKFNNTEGVLQGLLKLFLKNSSLGNLYSGCRLASLRSEKDGTATRVDAICTHRPDPKGFRLDREKIYWELSKMTHGITNLGPYLLDKDSLYVNEFTHQRSVPVSSSEYSTDDPYP